MICPYTSLLNLVIVLCCSISIESKCDFIALSFGIMIVSIDMVGNVVGMLVGSPLGMQVGKGVGLKVLSTPSGRGEDVVGTAVG
jgi:hypothetical protein